MNVSAYLALIFGVFFTAAAMPMLWTPKRLILITKDFTSIPALPFLAGIFLLIAGLSVVAFHNIWATDWRVLITLLGYAVAIKGGLYIILPDPMLEVGKTFMERPGVLPSFGFLYLAVGIFLLSRVLS